MSDFLALLTMIFWPVIPLFWIPVHGLARILKRPGLITYLLTLVTWIPLAYLIYSVKNFLLQSKIELPFILNISGITLLVLGLLLHVWTGKLLGLWGLIGLPEVYTRLKGKLVTEGPFSVVRHPTYFAHTLIFLGVFLITGVVPVGIITIIDIFLIHIFIIPLEDKELLNRFGKEYRLYREKVSRFFPRIHH
jgi:protein-S-isoprenylcysteine O-methyltransferase Ste14